MPPAPLGRSRLLLLLVVLAFVLPPGVVRAQTATERSDARAIADEGATAYENGDFDRALTLFQRAEAVVHSPMHQLFIARSQEATGRLVEARETYLAISRERLGPGAPEAFRTAQSKAAAELTALEVRIPYVTIEVDRVHGRPVAVTMNGRRLPSEVLGVRRPTNPGEYEIQAFAPGRKSKAKTLFVVEGESQRVRLILRKLKHGEPDEYGRLLDREERDEGDEEDAARGRRGPRRSPPEEGGGHRAPVEAYLALGVGGVGLVAGTLFALKSKSKRDEATDLCGGPGATCPKDQRPKIAALDDEADTNRNVAIGAFVGGGAAIALGVLLLLADGSGEGDGAARSSAPLGPVVGLGSAGVAGRF